MRKEMKNKFFVLIICAVVIVNSITVFAGSSKGEFGSLEGRAEARIECKNYKAGAQTSPLQSGVPVTTRVTCLSHLGNDVSDYTAGSGWVYTDEVDICCGAESRHTCGTSTYYLNCNHN